MKKYIISLSSAVARRTHITNEFSKKLIDFEFFDAVTPNQIDLLSEKFKININNVNLTQGELACLFSHVSLWQKCLDENLDYIAIFEDDVYLSKNAQLFLKNCDWIPKDVHIIKIEKFDEYCLLKKTGIYKLENAYLKILKAIHYGTAGYILSNNGAKQLIDFIKHTEVVPIDHIMFESTLNTHINVYQINPAICIQSDRLNDKHRTVFGSELETDRKKRFINAKYPHNKNSNFLGKLKKEATRPFYQLKNLAKKIFSDIQSTKINFE